MRCTHSYPRRRLHGGWPPCETGDERASSCDDAGPLRASGAALRSFALDHQGRAMTHVLDAIRRAACAGRVPGGKKQKGRFSLAGAGFSCAILQPRYAFAGYLSIMRFRHTRLAVYPYPSRSWRRTLIATQSCCTADCSVFRTTIAPRSEISQVANSRIRVPTQGYVCTRQRIAQ